MVVENQYYSQISHEKFIKKKKKFQANAYISELQKNV